MLFARASINGHDAGWFIIDTGASVTVIDDDAVRQSKLPTIGMMFNERLRGIAGGKSLPMVSFRELSLGPAAVAAGPGCAASGDLTFASAFVGFKVAGILGTDLLAGLPFTLDYRTATLTFYDRASFAPPAGALPFPLDTSTELPAVKATVDGHEGFFMLDTGSVADPIMYPRFVGLTRVARGKSMLWSARAMAGVPEHTFRARFARFEVLGRTLENVWLDFTAEETALTGPHALFAGVIGPSEFPDAALTIDWDNERLWVRRPPEETAEAMAERLGGPAGADLSGVTALMRAAARGRPDVVKLLTERGAKVNARSYRDYTALMYAAEAGHARVVEYLLRAGASTEQTAAQEAMTALHLAAVRGHPAVVRLLLGARADPNARTTSGETPLFYAATAGQVEIVRDLLAAGADPRARSASGRTALTFACGGSADPAVVALLIEKGAAAQDADSQSYTPLMAAAGYGRAASARMLLEHGARPDDQDAQGNTALIYAVKRMHKEVVELLLDHGADVNLRDHDARSAIDYASGGSTGVLRAFLMRSTPE